MSAGSRCRKFLYRHVTGVDNTLNNLEAVFPREVPVAALFKAPAGTFDHTAGPLGMESTTEATVHLLHDAMGKHITSQLYSMQRVSIISVNHSTQRNCSRK